jgi:hypothetical protein
VKCALGTLLISRQTKILVKGDSTSKKLSVSDDAKQ